MNPAAPVQSPASFEAAKQANVPRLALCKQEAAEALGMSDDSFDRYVRSHVPCVRRGRMRLYALRDLDRWLADNAALAGEERE